MNGKGDTYRPCDREKWEAGYKRAFGHKRAQSRRDKRRKK